MNTQAAGQFGAFSDELQGTGTGRAGQPHFQLIRQQPRTHSVHEHPPIITNRNVALPDDRHSQRYDGYYGLHGLPLGR